MGSKRQDIQCSTCGRYRHRKCDQCGQGNLIPDMQGRLVDHETRTLHVCGMAQVTSLPAQTQRLTDESIEQGRQQFKDALAQSGIQPKAMTDHIGTSHDMAQFIPPKSVLDRYLPRKVDGITDLEVMERAYKNGLNVLLVGDAGTGKNHLIDALGAKLGIPTVSISFNGGSTIEDVVGQPLFIGGETVWSDGWLPHLMRGPAILCGDEINACPNDISFVLHQVLDWRRKLVLVQKGREVVTSHPGFMFVGTMNPDYRGTKPLNEAFKDRFQVQLELDYDKTIEAKLGIPDNWLDLAAQLRKMYRETELETPCSTRMLLDYLKNKTVFGEHVARDCFIARYARSEQPAVRQAVSVHIDKTKTKDLRDGDD